MAPTKVFLSYAHADRVFVDTLAARLSKAGISVWYDKSLRGGQSWSRELEQQIDQADTLVVVISPAANASDWVEKEIIYAQSKHKPIVPFRLDGEPPLSLVNIQYVTSADDLIAALKGEPIPHKPTASARPQPTAAPRIHELMARFKGLPRDAPPDTPISLSVSAPSLGLDASDDIFVSPLDDKALADIRWYLELYPQWPSGPDYERAQRVEANLLKWGKDLFKALFKKSEARDIYRQFEREAGAGRLLTIQANEPRVLQLPWELLAEEGGFLFSQNPPISIRRRLPKYLAPKESPQFALPIRVLMAVSRPDDRDVGFLDPRSSARTLLDALDELGDAVVVEFLRPPTLEALDHALNDQTFHIVHFDGHGVYRRDVGVGYLLFERGDHSLDLVDANQIGTLLNQRNVPLVILDACQTAMQGEREFTSVASKLIEAGVGSVLAMNYSVLVPTTRKFVAAFYRALAEGNTIGAATEAGRRALLADKHRFNIYRHGKEEAVNLQDWFLPALYQQALDPVLFTNVGAALVAAHTRTRTSHVPTQPARGGFQPEPPHGFVGRARELLALERLFLPSRSADGKEKPAHRIVMLHGWGGQGKTALAGEAARWFARTRLFARAAFVSFERGGGLELALGELGNALVSDDFAIQQGDSLAAIENALTEKSALIVWDNFETLMEGGSAPLDDTAMRELLNAGLRWARAGDSRLLITTRDPEMPHDDYQPSRTSAYFELTGLATFDALALASAILDDAGIEPPRREELQRLLDFLGGHPLSLHLVVPQLRDYTPAQLVAEFDKLLPNFSQGAGKGKDESLRVSLEFSLNRLDPATRDRLPQLAVFQGGAWEPMIWRITDFTQDEWTRVRPQLSRAALIRVENLAGVSVPYIHFHPTLAPYLAALTPLAPSPKVGEGVGGEGDATTRFRRAYHQLASQLYNDDTQHPIQARGIVVREMANLRRALALMLAAGEVEAAVDFAECIVKFLNAFGRWRERDEVMRSVASYQSTVNSGEKLTKAEFLLESLRGETLLSQGYVAEAEQVFRHLLARMDAGMDYGGTEAGYHRVITLQRLGRCLKAQGKPNAAADAYRRALAAAETLEQDDDVKRTMGVAHTDLADVLTDLGRYDEARKEYEASLEIKKQIGGEERGTAVVMSQLGTLALRQGDLAEARQRYLDALNAFRNLGEEQGEAIFWHQLGAVAEKAKQWDEAEQYYKESLKIKERLGDLQGAAHTYNQLAIVARHAGRPADAERWYRRAIELKEQIGNPKELSSSLNNLAGLLLAHGRLDDAENLAQRAREIKETLDLSSEPWTTYNILAEIAEQRGRAEEARSWRRKERESFAAFAGSEQEIKEWLPVIAAMVAACQGNKDAQQQVEQLCAQLAQTSDWKNLAAAMRRIVAGERDGEALADELNLGGTAAFIVRRILDGLAG